MARKRKDHGEWYESRIVSLMRAGGSVDSITAQLRADGINVSRSTIARRMREHADGVKQSRAEQHAKSKAAVASSSSLPASPDDIPEGATLTQLDGWIKQAEAAINTAESVGDLSLMGTMLRVASSLAETRRKATPPERPDPNANPDFIKLAEQVRERLHKMVDAVTELDGR